MATLNERLAEQARDAAAMRAPWSIQLAVQRLALSPLRSTEWGKSGQPKLWDLNDTASGMAVAVQGTANSALKSGKCPATPCES